MMVMQEYLAGGTESGGGRVQREEEDGAEQGDTETFHGWVYIETETLSFFIGQAHYQ